MTLEAQTALFVMLGQTAEKNLARIEDTVQKDSLLRSAAYDLAELVPDKVRGASAAADAYRLFFVFESYLREFIVDVLTKDGGTWWDKIPPDVQAEITKLEQKEEDKSWMALG